jgi:hypothetical protein
VENVIWWKIEFFSARVRKFDLMQFNF